MSHNKKIKEGILTVKCFKNTSGEDSIECPACKAILKGSQAQLNWHYEWKHAFMDESVSTLSMKLPPKNLRDLLRK